MEALVPLFALGSLYVVNKNTKKKEGFNTTQLPNVNVADKNYEEDFQGNQEPKTAQLSTVNKYSGRAYTDKYFNETGLSTYSSNDGDYQSLTGDKVGSDYFQHNNMVPYFGSKSHALVLDENTAESILDNYTGAGSQDISKKEQAPLFEPNENYQWAHGAPNENDFYQSRVNASMKMANTLPFKQEQVAPGLGLGYGTEGGNGFNSGMMERDSWKPKTVDQLRTDNNPRASGISTLGLEGPAVSHIKNIGTEGKFEKNRPDRHYENGPDRWFTTGGLEKGETSRSIQVDRFTNRKTTGREYKGTAGNNSGEYIPGQVQKSRHIDLGPKPFGVAGANNKANPTTGDYGIQGKNAYPNNRSVGSETNYFGSIGYSVNAAVAPLMDMLRPTRKEDTSENMRPYQNASTHVPESYVYDPTQKAPTTHRETMEKSKFHMNINRQQNGDAYMVTEHQQANTTRAKTGDFFYAGGSSASQGTQEMRSYQAEYNQRNNDIKSSTIKGRMVPGNMKLTNHNINMKPAVRDQALKNERPLTATMPYQAPSVNTIGVSASNNNSLYDGINNDRNDMSIMDALKGNPYATDYKKVL